MMSQQRSKSDDSTTTGLPEVVVDFAVDFADQYIASFMQWDLINYFYQNPHVADTVTQVSSHMQRNLRVTRMELNTLTKSGLIHKIDFDDLIIYTLTENPDLRRELEMFMDACQDRTTYLQVVVRVMQHLGGT